MYVLYRLRELGLSARVLELANGIGGTWFWNRYPGARCDVESLDYSYSFSDELQQEWLWTERYASQPEILRYLNHVADRFDLRRDIQLETRVTHVHYDESANRWLIRTEDGAAFSSTFCIMAAGCLSSVSQPKLKGLDSFEGQWYHTARWPHEGVDFTGRRVAVVGTGSTGVQAIPLIAEQAEHLFVFQRTPNFSVPARNHRLDEEVRKQVMDSYPERRQRARDAAWGVPSDRPLRSFAEIDPDARVQLCEDGWRAGGAPPILRAFSDSLTNSDANHCVAEFVRSKIREIVSDSAIAEKLIPRDHPLGAKRLCVDTGYYETFNRANVTLVDVRESAIEESTPRGLRTPDAHYDIDAIVFALGFDAITGALLDIDIRGKDGNQLRAKWAAGPRTYLGLGVAGFPNLFTVTGPGSPSVLGNVIVSIEQHVDWITSCIRHMREHGFDRIEATVEAEDAWVAHVNELAAATLFPLANSWFLGANIPGKPRVFMPYVGGVPRYRETCNNVAANGYEGFVLASSLAGKPQLMKAHN